MRLFRVGSDTFVGNGRSVVRVGLVLTFPSPLSPSGRVVKVFEVLEVTRANPLNPLERGMLLALSLPNEKANAKEYEWGLAEECQVALEIADRQANLKMLERARRRN